MLKHIFWPIIDCSSLYATRVTCGQDAVLRRIGERGHFRSRDKNGGQTIRSAIAENPCHTQTARLYLLQNRTYCRLKFYIAGIGNFAYFFVKNSGKSKFLFAPREARRFCGITSFEP